MVLDFHYLSFVHLVSKYSSGYYKLGMFYALSDPACVDFIFHLERGRTEERKSRRKKERKKER